MKLMVDCVGKTAMFTEAMDERLERPYIHQNGALEIRVTIYEGATPKSSRVRWLFAPGYWQFVYYGEDDQK